MGVSLCIRGHILAAVRRPPLHKMSYLGRSQEAPSGRRSYMGRRPRDSLCTGGPLWAGARRPPLAGDPLWAGVPSGRGPFMLRRPLLDGTLPSAQRALSRQEPGGPIWQELLYGQETPRLPLHRGPFWAGVRRPLWPLERDPLCPLLMEGSLCTRGPFWQDSLWIPSGRRPSLGKRPSLDRRPLFTRGPIRAAPRPGRAFFITRPGRGGGSMRPPSRLDPMAPRNTKFGRWVALAPLEFSPLCKFSFSRSIFRFF